MLPILPMCEPRVIGKADSVDTVGIRSLPCFVILLVEISHVRRQKEQICWRLPTSHASQTESFATGKNDAVRACPLEAEQPGYVRYQPSLTQLAGMTDDGRCSWLTRHVPFTIRPDGPDGEPTTVLPSQCEKKQLNVACWLVSSLSSDMLHPSYSCLRTKTL
jgi:hypothetical protein